MQRHDTKPLFMGLRLYLSGLCVRQCKLREQRQEQERLKDVSRKQVFQAAKVCSCGMGGSTKVGWVPYGWCPVCCFLCVLLLLIEVICPAEGGGGGGSGLQWNATACGVHSVVVPAKISSAISPEGRAVRRSVSTTKDAGVGQMAKMVPRVAHQ